MLGFDGRGRALLGCAVVLAAFALTTSHSFADSSTTSLTSTPNPSLSGQSVTIEAVVRPVAGGAITGTVTFKDGSTDISGAVAAGTGGLGFPLIAGSEAHTCALQGGGGAKCWGLEGLLGDNSSSSNNTPVNVSGLAGAIAIGAGYLRACALTDVGGVKCWGYNANGELGDGTTTYRAAPVDVHGVDNVGLLEGIKAIGVGYQHTCAVTDSGGVKCWGYNGGGQLGDGTPTVRYTPVDVVGVGGIGLLDDVKAVAGGSLHTCALTNAGGVKCWGSNGSFGQLGNGNFDISLTPVNAIVWTSKDQDGSGLGVYGQRYNSLRAKAGGEFRVNTVVGNNQWQPSVAGFADTGFAVVWTSQNQDGFGNGVYAQAYNAAGQRVQVEFRVNTTAQSDQWQPQATAFSTGNFLTAWSSKNPANAVPGIYGQRLSVGGL